MGDSSTPTVDAAVRKSSFVSQGRDDVREATSRTEYGSIPNNDYHAPQDEHASISNSPVKLPARIVAFDLLRGILMPMMALDHTSLFLNAWPHGTARHGENDGAIVYGWSPLIGYVTRTFSHLCAPGFAFVLGIGVVYFSRSRVRLGWTDWQMTKHFVSRAIVLTLVSVIMGLGLSGGQTWFQNLILWALAVDYLISGILCLIFVRSESALETVTLPWLPDNKANDETQLLLESSAGENRSLTKCEARATAISWHIHNVLLVILALITIWWNIWLSPNNGYCTKNDGKSVATTLNVAIRIWFYPVEIARVTSEFPPMAWLSFALLGILYGRIVTARPWKSTTLSLATAGSGVLFALMFVGTRLFHFGNLSENCLHTPEQENTDRNPYLVSAASFFYIIKYPPDVAFWASTMAGNLIMLAVFEVVPARITSRFAILLAFGTSALFFYIVHLILLMALTSVVVALFGHATDIPHPITGEPMSAVTSLWGYWGTWGLAMAIMYPLCNWYSNFKRRTAADSIWRFF